MIFQNPPNIQTVNEFLNYSLGILVALVAYLYIEKNNQNNKLQRKINKIYEEHKSDLKDFSKEKTETFITNNYTMQKMIMLLDQLNDLIKDGNK